MYLINNSAIWLEHHFLVLAQAKDTRATRPFPSFPPTNLGKEKGWRRQTIQLPGHKTTLS